MIGMIKLAKMHTHWVSTPIQFCNYVTNERCELLLEFAKTNNLIIANTVGPHKKSIIQTWHIPGGLYHNKIDYILISNIVYTSVNINKTRSFHGADIGCDHDMVITIITIINDDLSYSIEEHNEK